MNSDMSNKTKIMSFYVEGPDWAHSVSLDPELFDDERAQLFEAASLALEKQIKENEDMNLGAIIIVKKSKAAKKEAFVNAYLCLVNIGHYKLAEELRTNFKKESGNDLAEDKMGYSF
jgi:hypothetical protein